MASTTINNWAVRSRTLIQPSSRQSSAYLNEVLHDIGDGFRLIDGINVVTSGATTTITAPTTPATSKRRVVIAANSLTHTVNLPSAPAAGDPPIQIMNAGTGNVVTISGNGKPIMSGSTAGQITLQSPGDYIELVFVNNTFGWAILGIRSNRLITPTGTGTHQLHRFQNAFLKIVDSAPWVITLAPPVDAQTGDTLDIALSYASGFASQVFITPASGTIEGSGSFELSAYWYVQANHITRLYKDGTNWKVSRYV